MANLKIKKLIILLILISFIASALPVRAVFIFSAKSRSQLSSENLNNVLLPVFRYDKNYIELKDRSTVELILNSDAKRVEVEVIKAEGTGLGIDNTTLLNDGLKILRSQRLRSKTSRIEILKEKKQEEASNNKVVFNLKNQRNQQNIIEAIDFKLFRILVSGKLSGTYTLQATVDGKTTATTDIITKPSFRIDALTPSVLDLGVDTELSIVGKGFDSLTEISFSDDIEIKKITSLDDSTLKITVFVPVSVMSGLHDLFATSPILGDTFTLNNALYVGPSLGINGMDGTPGPPGINGMNGINGVNGMDGTDGMGICDDSSATLMIFINNLPSGSQSTSFFDPVQCNLTLGIPIGAQGAQGIQGEGAQGPTGATGATGATGSTGSNALVKVSDESPGINCAAGGKKVESGIDTNGNGTLDASEVTATNYVCNGTASDPPFDIDDVITNWSTLSSEQDFTTASGDMTRMVKIPYFIHDGIIYGGFWIDKYEAARSDATATTAGTSIVPVSKRNVVPWASINHASAKANSSSSNRQVTGIGNCHLVKMKEWHTLYLLGRFGKDKGLFGATASNGWNERGNTRTGKDGRNDNSKTCTDDPVESGGALGRCLTGTGYKSWGHLIDSSATNDADGTALSGAGTADDTSSSTDSFDGDLQVYDLVGNILEWIDFTITKSGSDYVIDSGFPGANKPLPYTGNNKYFSFSDIAGNTNTSTASDEIEFRGLGFPRTGNNSNQTDLNGGANDGKLKTGSTNQQYGTVRGGSWSSSVDSRSPLYLDLSTTPTTTEDARGFRVTCDLD